MEMPERIASDLLAGGEALALLKRAEQVRGQAYAPYSGFSVGAALLDEESRVFTGVNVENAAYGLSTCAERGALVSAIAAGSRNFRAIAIAGPDPARPCPPCGSCRQLLVEFASDLEVILAGPRGPSILSLRELLPESFGRTHLDRADAR